jgi:hypothetical protein
MSARHVTERITQKAEHGLGWLTDRSGLTRPSKANQDRFKTKVHLPLARRSSRDLNTSHDLKTPYFFRHDNGRKSTVLGVSSHGND